MASLVSGLSIFVYVVANVAVRDYVSRNHSDTRTINKKTHTMPQTKTKPLTTPTWPLSARYRRSGVLGMLHWLSRAKAWLSQ